MAVKRGGHEGHEPSDRAHVAQPLHETQATRDPVRAQLHLSDFEQLECEPSRRAGCTDQVLVSEVPLVRGRQRLHSCLVLTAEEGRRREQLEIRPGKLACGRRSGFCESFARLAPPVRCRGGSTELECSRCGHHAPIRARSDFIRRQRSHRVGTVAPSSFRPQDRPEEMAGTTKGPRLPAEPLRSRVDLAADAASREPAYRELTSSGMPGPNVVDTAPFWM